MKTAGVFRGLPRELRTRHNMPGYNSSRQIFPYCAKPGRAVLLNQSRAPLSSNMAVWGGAVPGVASTRSRLRNLRRTYQMTQIRWAPERQHINPNEDYELRCWSERFDVPTDEIVAAVKRVGARVEDVAHELNRHGYSDATLGSIY